MHDSFEGFPDVAVIIPHLKQRRLLVNCLDSLRKTTYPRFSICIVDNGADASDIRDIGEAYPEVRVICMPFNAGYAGGCNAGLKATRSKYAVFLNDDTLVEPDWLDRLVSAAGRHQELGALQPKILSMKGRRQGRKVFDYAGAAGGMIDRLGYPYCLGRDFSGTEEDRGQYDFSHELFWASGVAMFVLRKAVEEAGGFDEDFFMHMEEIDLCWRLQLRGYRIVSVPDAVVYHEGGATLEEGSSRKIYFNHRNNIAMLIKNFGSASLAAVLPLRAVLECAAAFFYLFNPNGGLQKAAAVFRAAVDNASSLGKLLGKRRLVQQSRKVGDVQVFRNRPYSVFLPAQMRGNIGQRF
jgi:GT2 family glycosyltransferase